ncbi:MAG: type II toxin-antitoxin system VapC family toxin [Betaproteobacteria bacterium]|nr:type II toxin-antitoxin system VapC family toxin [Betaproteobacteria bacterium]
MYYFDTSFLAPLILEESTTARIESFMAKLPAGALFVSQWTRLEFSSVLAREVRIGGLTQPEARTAGRQFDRMVEDAYHILTPSASDFDTAKEFVENYATKLRAGDALHLAIARNNEMRTVYTLDEGLIKAGKRLKVPVSRGIR